MEGAESVFIRKERMHACIFPYVCFQRDVRKSASGRTRSWRPVKRCKMRFGVSHRWQFLNGALFSAFGKKIKNRLHCV